MQACPSGALKLIGTWWTPEAVVELALRDKRFYDRSGGGMTISGGEPMAQFEPVLETLKLAKGSGIHTCLDTCGQAPLAQYRQILPYVDLFLWDIKATGAGLHRAANRRRWRDDRGEPAGALCRGGEDPLPLPDGSRAQ